MKPDIQRQTWEQMMLKAPYGVFRGLRSFEIKFHWKFWAPLDAVGGKIYFGSYAEYDRNELTDRDRMQQARRANEPTPTHLE